MSEMDVVTADHEGFQITSNSAGSHDQLIANLDVEKPPKEEPDLSKAASELGKKGGKAAAEKRREALQTQESEEKPEQKEPEEDTEEEAPEKPPETETEPEKLGKPRHDPKARMLEATRKEAEAKREAAKAREEARTAQAERDAIRRELEASKAPPEPPKPSGRPQRASFGSDEDYVEAVADWKTEEKFKSYREQQEAEGRVRDYSRTIDAILGKHKATGVEYEKTDPGWRGKLTDEVKELATKPTFFMDPGAQTTAENVIADEIYFSDSKSPLLLVHLSEHPEELERIKALHSAQEVQIEMRLLARTLNGAAPTATVPKSEISKAPPPVRSVAGAPPSVSEEGHTPERAAKQSLDDYSRGWKPHRR